MEPTVQRGDYIVADTWQYRSHQPERIDVVVFNANGTLFIKRVIAAGGDTIEGQERAIFVNGNLLDEEYVQHTNTVLAGDKWMNTFGPVKVPAGKYFVMGDNRDVSLDSRSPDFGLVDGSTVVGKALYIYSSGRQGTKIH